MSKSGQAGIKPCRQSPYNGGMMTEEELLEIEARWADCRAEDDISRLIAEVRRLQSADNGVRYDAEGKPYFAIRDQMR